MCTTNCIICGKLTRSLGTKKCDACWELDWRIRNQPELARQILATISIPAEGAKREQTYVDGKWITISEY